MTPNPRSLTARTQNAASHGPHACASSMAPARRTPTSEHHIRQTHPLQQQIPSRPKHP